MVVNGYSAGWLKRGFCWIYPAEILRGAIVPGAETPIYDDAGHCLGTGIADEGWIAVRRFRKDEGVVGEAVKTRLAEALSRRAAVASETGAWRLLNAENDDVPGVRADVWASHLVITLDSPHLSGLAPVIRESARSLLPHLSNVHLAYRRDPRDAREGGTKPRAMVPEPPDVVVLEAGLRFATRPWLGKDAGLFSDMRGVRGWLAPHWHGRRVLNLFAHTGAFSVHAAKNGATAVTTIDLAETYLHRAKENFRLNELDPDHFEFAAEESFHALDRLRRAGRKFDIIVVDPPGFSHSAEGDWRGEKDWPRLTAACLRVLEPGGWLVAASNLGSQSPREFGGALQQGAERAGRELRLVHEGSSPIDFPAALHFPESRYFKCWVMESS